VDYSPDGWPRTNDLGHAIATFETIGRMLTEPRIEAALLWTTRWMDDEEATADQFYALGRANELLPSGLAVALWGRHLRRDLVAVDGGTPNLTAHASADEGKVTLWLVNRGYEGVPAAHLTFGRPVVAVTTQVLAGGGPHDCRPVLSPAAALLTGPDGSWMVACPGISITMVEAVVLGGAR